MAGSVGSSCVCMGCFSLQSRSNACSEEMWRLFLGACVCIYRCYLSLCAAASRHQGMTCPEKERYSVFFPPPFIVFILKPQLSLRSF